ncbi:MAG: MaoC family dehydratase [Deltaproteobacteria bacterium]|nr:MaoC family dehydratase [Deltaproteobacteria bacterium]
MSLDSLKQSDVKVGDQLPELVVPLTTSLIVSGAIASRDFTPVHHDKAAAQASGVPDVFMNILTTNGLVNRYVTDWAGPNASVRNVQIKLGTPNTPGDDMTFNGSVTSKEGDEVTVELAGKNAWGDHVTASVRLALPA